MLRLWRALSFSALFLCAAQAGAQFAPPAPSGGAATARVPAGNGPLMAVRPDQALTIDAMIGSVNGGPIFLSDLFRPIDANLRELARTAANRADFEAGARTIIRNQLSALASDIVVVSAAESQLTDQDKTRIEFYLAMERKNLIDQYAGVESAAERALHAVGSSIDKEMRDKRRSVIKSLYFEKNLRPQVVITWQMVHDAYEKDPKRWQQIAQVELSTITLPITNWLRGPSQNGELGPILTNPTDAQIKDAETKALVTGEEIVARLKKGEEFARLVEDYNSADDHKTGGSRGMINKGSMQDSKFEDYIFSLKADSIGGPVLSHETKYSAMRVVKVGARKTARMVPFEEAQATLYDELKLQQLQDLERQEMARLSSRASFESIDRNIDVAVDAAVARYATK